MMAVGTLQYSPPLPASEAMAAVPWERVDHFVGQFTHDIRNGLNAIELQLTFLGEISTDPEAVDEVKRLRGTLLDVTRQLQAVKTALGPIRPNVLEYPAADLLEDLRERLERLHPAAKQAVSWGMTVDPAVLLMIDPDLSINGLLELFVNTFRFGGASIRCTAAMDHAEKLRFTLHEIPAAPPTIDPLRWGLEPLLSSRRGAYGLGLFRVRRILEAQGGTYDAAYSSVENLLLTTATFPKAPLTSRG